MQGSPVTIFKPRMIYRSKPLGTMSLLKQVSYSIAKDLKKDKNKTLSWKLSELGGITEEMLEKLHEHLLKRTPKIYFFWDMKKGISFATRNKVYFERYLKTVSCSFEE